MTTVQLVLKLVDKATQGVDKVAKTVVRSAKGMRDAQVQGNDAVSQSYTRMGNHAVGEFRKLSSARETLGVRSERRVQQEIAQTQAAYQRLARSGTLSTRELIRAKQAEIAKVRELNAELGKGGKLNAAISVGAGIAAGGYVIGREASKAMSFDERLALMANTAFSGQGVQGRQLGMKQLESVINRSTQAGVGGGTRDQAAMALDAMIAKNTLGLKRSMDMLPTVMRTATGSGADPLDIANLASVLVGQRVVNNDTDLKRALNMITASGQAGGFEIKDQARWLAQQLPLAQKSGLMGLNGLQQVLTMNQAAILTSGTTDEAGNNVRNLLAKLNSADTAKDFEKLGRGDLGKFLMTKRTQGVDAVTAWMQLIDQESAKNPEMKAVLAKLKQSKNKAEQKELIDSLNAIAEGTVVGQFFQDMQATSALLALRNKPIVDEVNQAISKNRTVNGVNDTNYALIQSTSSAQVRAAQQAKDAAVKNSMDNLTPTIGKLSAQFADLANKHPALAGAAVVATTSITAMAGAAGLATLALGGKGAGIKAAGAVLARGALKSGVGRAGALGLGGVAVGAGLNALLGEDSKVARYGTAALNGAAIGGMLGSFVPIIGTTIGATVGGAAGMVNEYLYSPKQEPAKVETVVKVQLADGLKATSQTTNTQGPVKSWLETGSVWGIP